MKDFDRWVLVTPPEILRDFRQHLGHMLKDALASELAKDLTKILGDKVPAHLHSVLPIRSLQTQLSIFRVYEPRPRSPKIKLPYR